MKTVLTWALACVLLVAIATTPAQASTGGFQLIVAQAPWGDPIPPQDWKGVLRFSISGTGGAAVPLSAIPNGQVFDPVAVTARSTNEFLVGNRHGNLYGAGSVSFFALDASGTTYAYDYNLTYPGMNGVCGMAFHPVTGELFLGTHHDGGYRFVFVDGVPVFNGQFAGGMIHDVYVNASGDRLYAAAAEENRIRQFTIAANGDLTELPSVPTPGSFPTFFTEGPRGDLYLTTVHAMQVWRYAIDAQGNLVYRSTMNFDRACDVAFSPDGMEMFVTRNKPDGGVYRFAYQQGSDSWLQTGFISAPWAAGIELMQPVPEPACFLGLLLGLGGLAVRRRR